MDLLKEAAEIEPEIIKIRREIHQKPELAYHEVTSKLVAERLEALGIQVKRGVGGTGVLGVLKGPRPGKVVGLRADMDALPLDEMADVEFKSKVKGVMHACGHDTHVAMLLGAARLLANHKNELQGTEISLPTCRRAWRKRWSKTNDRRRSHERSQGRLCIRTPHRRRS